METHSVSIFSHDLLSSYISTFEDMRCRGELIDIKITVQNKSFCGHRLILAAGIPYFRKMFASSESEIVVDDIDPDVLEPLISFAYSGKIEITDGNVRYLLSASKYLQVAQVHNACWEFLEKRLSLCNVMEIRNLAEKYNCPKLVDTSDLYIRSNFEAFLESQDLLKLEFAFLKDVIRRDEVNVSTEEKVFEAVIRWVQVSPSERKYLLPQLLTAVRLPLLTPDYLTERVCSEELVTTSRDCMQLVDAIKNLHLPTKKIPQFTSLVTRPRVYPMMSQYTACADDRGNNVYALCGSPDGTSVKLLDSRNAKWMTVSTTHDHYQDIVKVIASTGKICTFSLTAINVFDLKTLTWQTVEEKQMQLRDFGATSHKNKIYFVGGEIRVLCRVLCFDTMLNKWLQERKINVYTYLQGVSSLEGYIYITGGKYGIIVRSDVVRYDPERQTWARMTSMISPRYEHACCSLNGKVYVCGGYDSRGCLSSAEVFDPLTNKWNSIYSIKTPKDGFSLVPYDGKLYALGEQSKACGGTYIEIYDPKCNEWKSGITVSDDDKCDVFLVSAKVPSGS